jgi:chromosomal replication initiator protein
LEERLRSRFEWGLIADISDPDLDMRIAIIRKKMLLEKIAVSDEVVSYIAETVDTNVRELEGALTKVVMYSQLKGVACPDIAIAKEALKAGKSQEKGDITGEVIIDTVANYFGVSKAEIIGKKKKKEIVEARMVAVYMVNEALSLPLVSIGQMFGGRDHTTVIHSRDKISEQLKTDANLERKIKDIWALMGR